jgi:hypothetical protein
VIAEDIDMHGMARALRFGRSVADSGWGMFVNMLRRRLEERGKRFVRVDRFYPSSKTCSACGAVKPALGLAERVYVCDLCGHARDRDVNAALNIRAEGLRMLGLAIDKNRGTRGVSPDVNLAGPRRHTGSPWALARGMSHSNRLLPFRVAGRRAGSGASRPFPTGTRTAGAP